MTLLVVNSGFLRRCRALPYLFLLQRPGTQEVKRRASGARRHLQGVARNAEKRDIFQTSCPESQVAKKSKPLYQQACLSKDHYDPLALEVFLKRVDILFVQSS